jgi:hypothetical protein
MVKRHHILNRKAQERATAYQMVAAYKASTLEITTCKTSKARPKTFDKRGGCSGSQADLYAEMRLLSEID